MKIISTFHILGLFMAVLMFSTPFVALTQQLPVPAVIDAEADANRDVNKPLWFGAGVLLSGAAFLLKPYGYVILPLSLGGYLYQPAPPPSRLIGKSPEYVTAYVSAYKSKVADIQGNMAGIGCLSGCIVIAVAGGGIGFGLGSLAVTQ